MLILIRQKMVKSAKIEKFKCDILDDFKQCVGKKIGWKNRKY